MVKDLNAYYEKLKAARAAKLVESEIPAEVSEELDITKEPIEEFVQTVHGYDIYVRDGIYSFMDDGTKYVSSDLSKIEDKALELKDLHSPTIIEPETYQSIRLKEIIPGEFSFESPWGNGVVKIRDDGEKEKIQILHNSNVFFGEAPIGSYMGRFDRIQELIRANLNEPIIDEAADLRKWSDANGKTLYEQLFKGNDNE